MGLLSAPTPHRRLTALYPAPKSSQTIMRRKHGGTTMQQAQPAAMPQATSQSAVEDGGLFAAMCPWGSPP